jgi:cellulase/cellobiase CelA1
MSTPTPRTDAAVKLTFAAGHNTVCPNFARTLERELHESRNAERLARVQIGNEREKVQRLVEINEFVGSVQLAAEREKVKALRLACERIVEQWDKNHDAAPFHAGNVMYSRASAALAATEDAQ